jgi:hypothetical protein
MRVALAAIVVLLSAEARAHPHLPLRPGDVTVLDYRFHVETSRKEFRVAETKGTMTITTEAAEERNGKSWVRFRTTYDGIPYMTTTVETWRREENGDVYVASMRDGLWSETLELPADVSLGAEWDYDDGEPSRRKVTALVDLELGGRALRGCIEVLRIPKNADRKNVTNRNTYCPDVGEVRFHLEATSPVGTYVTATSLRTHTRSKAQTE